MKKPTTNFGHSVRTRLLTLANQQGVQLEYVLLRYAFERFLYRLGVSSQADRFVLKGASAFAVWIGPFCRVTRDADLEAFGDVSAEGTEERCARVANGGEGMDEYGMITAKTFRMGNGDELIQGIETVAKQGRTAETAIVRTERSRADEVEKRTGFDFFAKLPDAEESRLESKSNFAEWKLPPKKR